MELLKPLGEQDGEGIIALNNKRQQEQREQTKAQRLLWAASSRLLLVLGVGEIQHVNL